MGWFSFLIGITVFGFSLYALTVLPTYISWNPTYNSMIMIFMIVGFGAFILHELKSGY